MGLVERVSRAICFEAGKHIAGVCVYCEDGECNLWKSFRGEARAAITVVKKERSDSAD